MAYQRLITDLTNRNTVVDWRSQTGQSRTNISSLIVTWLRDLPVTAADWMLDLFYICAFNPFALHATVWLKIWNSYRHHNKCSTEETFL